MPQLHLLEYLLEDIELVVDDSSHDHWGRSTTSRHRARDNGAGRAHRAESSARYRHCRSSQKRRSCRQYASSRNRENRQCSHWRHCRTWRRWSDTDRTSLQDVRIHIPGLSRHQYQMLVIGRRLHVPLQSSELWSRRCPNLAVVPRVADLVVRHVRDVAWKMAVGRHAHHRARAPVGKSVGPQLHQLHGEVVRMSVLRRVHDVGRYFGQMHGRPDEHLVQLVPSGGAHHHSERSRADRASRPRPAPSQRQRHPAAPFAWIPS